MQAAILIPVKKAPYFIFKFRNAFHRKGAKPPCHILIWQPFAANNRIHKMPLNRITAAKRDIIAALHHPCAAAFPY